MPGLGLLGSNPDLRRLAVLDMPGKPGLMGSSFDKFGDAGSNGGAFAFGAVGARGALGGGGGICCPANCLAGFIDWKRLAASALASSNFALSHCCGDALVNALNFSAPEAAVDGFGLPLEAGNRAFPAVPKSFVV